MKPVEIELKPLETVKIFSFGERMPKDNEAILFGSSTQPMQLGRVEYPTNDLDAKEKGYCYVQLLFIDPNRDFSDTGGRKEFKNFPLRSECMLVLRTYLFLDP